MNQDTSNTIAYFGDDVDQIVLEHADMASHIKSCTEELTHAQIKVYVEPRNEHGCLQWQLNITSPRGRQSYFVTQFDVGGKFNVSKPRI